jgi:hypothetical protein
VTVSRGWICDRGTQLIHQLWGPLVDLVGNGGFAAWTFSWFTLKIGNLIEMILVILIFLAGAFVNLPGGRVTTSASKR